MKLSLRETMGALNEKALHEAQRLVQAKVETGLALAELRRVLAMPGFPGNLLAVRLTDETKVRQVELPADLEPARDLLLAAIHADVVALEPQYRERLANSHK